MVHAFSLLLNPQTLASFPEIADISLQRFMKPVMVKKALGLHTGKELEHLPVTT